jgi:photosystem II stability/assembly factor-like uncharacterized protein
VGAMRSADCDAAKALREGGVKAEAFGIYEGEVIEGSGRERLWRELEGLTERRRIKLPGEGELIAVSPAGDFFVSQWREGSKAPAMRVHLKDGTLAAADLAAPADEFLFVDPAKGLVFLRWENGRPAAWVELPARMEWRRSR